MVKEARPAAPSASASQATAATRPEAQKEAMEFAISAARTLADNRATDVVAIDLRGRSSLADFFVIGTGTSDRQMSAALARVEEFARTINRRTYKTSDHGGTWSLADYVDVVVHLFDAEHREYYDLDGLWGEAPRIEWASFGGTSKTA